MDNNWSEVRRQMDQVLASERQQRQARRRQQPSFWQSLRQRWSSVLHLAKGQRRSPARVILAALAVALLLATQLRPAHAATITVANPNDSGPGSLRQAIADAASGDAITFNLPNPSTITLSSELVIAKNLTIQGPGATALTISGANNTRVFLINPGASGATSGPPSFSPTVTIADLTIANGIARGGNGGFGAPISSPSSAGGGGGAGMGGAIFSNKSQLTIRGVIFGANQALGGMSGGSLQPQTIGSGYGGGGMGLPHFYDGGYGMDGGALGGKGGAVADGTLQGPYGNGVIGPIGYPGGDGAGGGGGLANNPSPGGAGGFGGGGGGGGAGIIDSFYGNTGGPGGVGGFGGGGGGGGNISHSSGYGVRVAGGNGGQFGGKGGTGGIGYRKGSPGGGGAGLGGAIFIRAGTLTLVDSSFLNNSATGGSGEPDSEAQAGQGKGGAVFLLTIYNGQSTGSSVTAGSCATFSGNSAANAAGSALDNQDLYGVTATQVPTCDRTPPVITPNVAGTLGSNGWYVSNVSVTWSVTDPESPVTSQTGCEPQSVTSDTPGVTFTCSATSGGGSNSQSVTIMRDATAPTISAAATTAANGAGWYNSDVTVHFTCDDNLSQVANCPADEVLSSEGSAVASTAWTILDIAGNSSAPSNFVTANIDKSAPVFGACPAGGPFAPNSGVVTVGPIEVDAAVSGLDQNPNASTLSGSVDTSTAGTKSVTFSATDNAGNSNTKACTYAVNYVFTGFLQPVDNLPVLNQVKAGQGIPMKFNLGGNYGLAVLAPGSPSSQRITCPSAVPTDVVEETVTTSNSGLTYDAATNQYTYLWKTDKGWADTCRQFNLTLADGTVHSAGFSFTK